MTLLDDMELSSGLCPDLDGEVRGGRNTQEGGDLCIHYMHSYTAVVVQQKLTQPCKAVILPFLKIQKFHLKKHK